MLYKGVVCEIYQNHAIVVTSDMCYMKIRRKDAMRRGREILFVPDDIWTGGGIMQRAARYAAAFLLLLFSAILCLGGQMFQIIDQKTAAVLSIDFNPSVQLDINRDGKVIKLSPMSAGSSGIINSGMVGKDTDEVAASILLNAKREGYLTPGNQDVLLAVSVFSPGFTSASTLTDEVRQYLMNFKELKEIRTYNLEITRNEFNEAGSNGISIGREGLYSRLKQADESITLDEVRGMGIGQLLKMQYGKPEEQPPSLPEEAPPLSPPGTPAVQGNNVGNDEPYSPAGEKYRVMGGDSTENNGKQNGKPLENDSRQYGKPDDANTAQPETPDVPTPAQAPVPVETEPSPGDCGSNPDQSVVNPSEDKKPDNAGEGPTNENGCREDHTGGSESKRESEKSGKGK